MADEGTDQDTLVNRGGRTRAVRVFDDLTEDVKQLPLETDPTSIVCRDSPSIQSSASLTTKQIPPNPSISPTSHLHLT